MSLLLVMVECCLAACSAPEPTLRESRAEQTTTPADTTGEASVAAEEPSEDRTAAAPQCPPSLRIPPHGLEISWQQHLGARVAFPSRIERSLDFAQVTVRAHDGARFAVTLSPDQVWTGERVRAFVVGGAAMVRVRGATVLPQLFLDDDCSIARGAS